MYVCSNGTWENENILAQSSFAQPDFDLRWQRVDKFPDFDDERTDDSLSISLFLDL